MHDNRQALAERFGRKKFDSSMIDRENCVVDKHRMLRGRKTKPTGKLLHEANKPIVYQNDSDDMFDDIDEEGDGNNVILAEHDIAVIEENATDNNNNDDDSDSDSDIIMPEGFEYTAEARQRVRRILQEREKEMELLKNRLIGMHAAWEYLNFSRI